MWADMLPPLASRPASLLGLFVAVASSLPLVLASPGHAAEQAQIKISIEAETYARSYLLPGEHLDCVYSPQYASGGYAVIGLDVAGDWMEWDVTVPAPMVFRDSIRSAGENGIRRGYLVTFTARDSGMSPVADTLITRIGRGWG